MEAAIKFARAATGRNGIAYADGAYHGLTLGALSANGCASFRDGFGNLLDPARKVPFGDLEAIEEALAPKDIAALLLEPIQGKGVFIPPPGYLAEAGRIARAHGTLLVIDEVQTGLGRTGSFLAIDQEGDVKPDVVVVSKALSGGFVPVGAVLVREETWSKTFNSLDRAVVHSSTFAQGGMAMAAGLAYLSVLDDEHLCEQACAQGETLRTGLESLQPRFEMLGEIRQRGLMIGIEFKKPTSLSLKTGWAAVHAMDSSLFPQAITMPLLDEHSILTQVAGHNLDVVKLTPPLVIDDSDVRSFLDAFEQVLVSLHRFPGPAWKVIANLGKHALRRGGAPGTRTEDSPMATS
jgi:acetylornithine/succinyldiaminopimelate/putrescine aminotransferase